MRKRTFSRSVSVPVDIGRLWDWHMLPGAFERLAPPWQQVQLLQKPDRLEAGAEVLLRLKAGLFKRNWRARIETLEPGKRFVDVQEEGPFAKWRHEHLMTPDGPGASTLTDSIDYSLPMGLGGIPGGGKMADHQLERLFRFRHERMRLDLQRYPEPPGRGRTVLVSGATGLIGSRLVPFLKTLGFTVRGLTRGKPSEDLYQWDPSRGWIDPAALEGVQVVIHLAGAGIATGRWTEERRKAILQSRVDGTRTLVGAMARQARKPDLLLSSSGVNYYAADGQPKDESSPTGDGFLAEVCRQWEGEALKAVASGIRTVCLRTAVVLDPSGGALGRMLTPFRLGLGGPIGSGQQGFPWIGIDDLLDIFIHLIESDSIEGPVNAVHPEYSSQGTLSQCLARVLGRPAVLPLPAFGVKLLFGRMGEETLLADLDIRPGILQHSGFIPRFKSLGETLEHLLGRAGNP